MSTDIIDKNFYSRQIGTYGLRTQEKIIKMNILIYGMRGVGIETAKNLVLSGPKSLTIFDPNPAKINDLTSNYFLKEEDVKLSKRRDEACLSNLSELNPYVKINLMEENDIIQNIKKKLTNTELKYDLVVITEFLPKNKLIEINKLCRDEHIGFILSLEFGIYGYIFVDFGNNFTIFDETGEEVKEYLIKNITKEKNGKVTINTELSGDIKLTSNDFFSFKEIKGMTELNNCQPMKFKSKLNKNELEICDTSNFSDYISGGVLFNVKTPKTLKFDSFEERLDEPFKKGEKYIEPLDSSNINIQEILGIGLLSLFAFFDKKNQLPEINNIEDEKELLIIAQNILKEKEEKDIYWVKDIRSYYETYDIDFDLIFKRTLKHLSNWAKTEICPISSFLGGVTAQEIIKFSGKYKPIHQWFYCDFSQIVNDLNIKESDKKILNSRYDDQIAIFGNEIQKKLSETNIFIIGAGALGCEFLKTFASMGIATQNEKRVSVTDNDNIELSNLNRQFLFNKNSIGRSKSEVACETIKKMNGDFNCVSFKERVDEQSENFFDEDFWNKQNFIINAVDNIEARKYIAEQCLIYKKVLIDSGTLGTKANSQIMIPHKTIPYIPPPEKNNDDKIAVCTIADHPFNINHCIIWAKNNFEGYFKKDLEDVQLFLKDRDKFCETLIKETPYKERIPQLKKIIEYSKIAIEKNFEKCVEKGLEEYNLNFRNKIIDLLEVNKKRSNFWTGDKRLPHPLSFNINDKYSFLFVKRFAQILSRSLSIPIIDDDEEIIKIISKIKIDEYIPKQIIPQEESSANQEYKISKEKDNEQKEEMKLTKKQVKNCIKEFNLYFDSLDKNIDYYDLIKIEEFNKDDDSKGHVEFLYACTNLRAENYNISKCDISKVKIVAGNIIPAIASTTAAIVGIVAMQLYLLVQSDETKNLRNCNYFDLAKNIICFEKVRMPRYIQEENDKLEKGKKLYKLIPEKFTIWDYLEINGSFSIKQLIDYMKQKYNVEVTLITSNQKKLFEKNSTENVLNEKIEDAYNNKSNIKLSQSKKFLMLEILGDVDNFIAKMPKFKYNFK